MLLSIFLLCSLVWSGSGIFYTGNDCEYVRLAWIHANPGCDNGEKFVLKTRRGVRKQFLILNNEAVLVFVQARKKFPQCSRKTDVTSKVCV